jgi:hypothetical protein
VNQTGLALGTYNATLQVSYTGSSAPATVAVNLTVITSAPFIGLGATSRSFVAQQNGANPPVQTVGVTNAGAGNLTGLATSIQYTAGQPTGWLSATLTGTTAPATITLRATTGPLPSATYTANVRVTSPVAQNSPQTIVVTFTVGGTPGIIAVDPTSLSFTANTTADPPSRGVQVTNTGGASLEGLAVSVS